MYHVTAVRGEQIEAARTFCAHVLRQVFVTTAQQMPRCVETKVPKTVTGHDRFWRPVSILQGKMAIFGKIWLFLGTFHHFRCNKMFDHFPSLMGVVF